MNEPASFAHPFMRSIVALLAGWLLLGRRMSLESDAAPKLLFAAGMVAAVGGFFVVVWLGPR